MTTGDLREELERQRKELQPDLEGTIEDTMREAALPNAIAWVGVVVVSFAINLGLLVIVAGP